MKKQSENAIKWIEALLSVKYKQGKRELGNEGRGFCCWGIGCKVVDREYASYAVWDDDFNSDVGFNSPIGYIEPELYGKDNLQEVNDDTSAGFKRIGKYLIKHSGTNFNSEVSNAIQKHFKRR